jgi:hypothetical protein
LSIWLVMCVLTFHLTFFLYCSGVVFFFIRIIIYGVLFHIIGNSLFICCFVYQKEMAGPIKLF